MCTKRSRHSQDVLLQTVANALSPMISPGVALILFISNFCATIVIIDKTAGYSADPFAFSTTIRNKGVASQAR